MCHTFDLISLKCREESAQSPRKKKRKKEKENVILSTRSSVSKFRCIPDRMKLTCHRVTLRKISMRGAARARTKQNVEAESIKMMLARLPRPPVRLSNQSATNEQHELACKTTRRGVPARRVVNPSPRREQIDGSIHRIRAHESSHFGCGIPPRGSTRPPTVD